MDGRDGWYRYEISLYNANRNLGIQKTNPSTSERSDRRVLHLQTGRSEKQEWGKKAALLVVRIQGDASRQTAKHATGYHEQGHPGRATLVPYFLYCSTRDWTCFHITNYPFVCQLTRCIPSGTAHAPYPFRSGWPIKSRAQHLGYWKPGSGYPTVDDSCKGLRNRQYRACPFLPNWVFLRIWFVLFSPRDGPQSGRLREQRKIAESLPFYLTGLLPSSVKSTKDQMDVLRQHKA